MAIEHELRRAWSLARDFGARVLADPLGVRPAPDSPAGQMSSAEVAKVALAAGLAWVVAHGTDLTALLGDYGTAAAVMAAALLQVWRLLGKGYAPAQLHYIDGKGLGVTHPLPGDPARLGLFLFAGELGVQPPPPMPAVPVEDSPDVIPFPEPAAAPGGSRA